MDKSYHEISSSELVKRLEYLQKHNYVDFFRYSDEFVLAISLAYFSLAEELIVERDTKVFDISTRFSKLVDDSTLNSLLTDDINIRDKEKDGNSVEWFLSALRNGIIHNGFVVDYENKVINILNDGALNKLDCSVSFEWFLNFSLSDILSKKILDNYKYTVVLVPFVLPKDASYIGNLYDMKNAIDNELFAYDIEISFNSDDDSKVINRGDFIEFCNNKKSLFWRLIYIPDSLDHDAIKVFEKYKEIINNELSEEKEYLASDVYNKMFYNRLFGLWFSEEFKKDYPNYNVSVSDFNSESPKFNLAISVLNDEDLEKKLFTSYREKKEFYNKHPVFQRMDIARAIDGVVNYDKVDYLMALQDLLNIYLMNKDLVRDEYGLSKFMREVLRSNPRMSHTEIQEMYLKSIYDGLLEEGITHTYDKQITQNVINMMNYRDEDICIRCRELCENFGDDISEENLNEIISVLKREYPAYYENISSILLDKEAPSDQVLSIYNENDLYKLCNVKMVIDQNLDEIIIGLLYTLGINTYVVNKENVFADFSDVDYSFMDTLNIKGYSKDCYTMCEDIRIKRRSNNKHIKAIDSTIPGIKKGINLTIDSNVAADKRNRIALLLNDRKKYEKDNLICDELLKDRCDESFGGINMSSLTNLECATTIRNCFSHCGRIFIDGREPGGEIRLILTDYDENGNLSGVVKTDLSSLISFFNNPVFKKAINESEKSSINKSNNNLYFL